MILHLEYSPSLSGQMSICSPVNYIKKKKNQSMADVNALFNMVEA